MFEKFLIYLPEDNQNEDNQKVRYLPEYNLAWLIHYDTKRLIFTFFVNFIRSLKLRCRIAFLVA